MYNTAFEMKQAKFLVMSKESYHKNRGNIINWKNRIYMDRTYGIYTYSFEDALIFLEKELIEYFKKNNLKNMRVSERKDRLCHFYAKFKIYDLTKGIDIAKEFAKGHNFSCFFDLELGRMSCSYLYSNETRIYIINSYDIIEKIAQWNNIPYRLRFSFPTLKVNEEYPHWKYQHKPTFHNRDQCCNRGLRIHKSEMLAGTDPEYSCYLTVRQKNRERSQNFGATWKKNRFQIPGDWKHYHKCRKQWAKNIDNPSYEKLSKAIWNYELECVKNED